MKIKNLNVIIIVFLAGITAFSVYKYAVSFKEKSNLVRALNDAKEQAFLLEQEKQNLLQDLEKERNLKIELTQENVFIKDKLNNTETELNKIKEDFGQIKANLDKLNSDFGVIKEENVLLRDEKNQLTSQLTQLKEEKDKLDAKLSSISELKKAIKDLKKKIRSTRSKVRSNAKVIEKLTVQRPGDGNRGFVLKDGKPTYSLHKVKIYVLPSSTQENTLPVNNQ